MNWIKRLFCRHKKKQSRVYIENIDKPSEAFEIYTTICTQCGKIIFYADSRGAVYYENTKV